MKVSFDIEENEIAKLVKRETEIAASAIVKKMVRSADIEGNNHIEAEAREAIRNIINERSEEIVAMAARLLKGEMFVLTKGSQAAYQAIKDVIYSSKTEIIDAVIERATNEVVRRGLKRAYAEVLSALDAKVEEE